MAKGHTTQREAERRSAQSEQDKAETLLAGKNQALQAGNSTPQRTQAAKKTNDTPEKPPEYRPGEKKLLTWGLVISALGLLVLSTYTCVTYRQWDTAHETFKESIRTREIENRAYLSVKECVLSYIVGYPKEDIEKLKVGKYPSASATYINAGRTPATIVSTKTSLRFQTSPITAAPLEFESWETIPNVNTLGPGLEGRAFGNSAVTTEADTLERLGSKSLYLYMYGIIEYDDQFGRHHKTEFCQEYSPTVFSFTWCKFHNTAD